MSLKYADIIKKIVGGVDTWDIDRCRSEIRLLRQKINSLQVHYNSAIVMISQLEPQCGRLAAENLLLQSKIEVNMTQAEAERASLLSRISTLETERASMIHKIELIDQHMDNLISELIMATGST